MDGGITLEGLLPHRFPAGGCGPGPAEKGEDLLRHKEGRLLGPTQVFFCRPDLLRSKGGAVCAAGILLSGRPAADGRPDPDERRSCGLGLRLNQGPIDRRHIVAVGNGNHVPAGGGKPPADLLGETEGRGSRQDDPVIVVQDNELSQAEMPRQGGGLGRRAPP